MTPKMTAKQTKQYAATLAYIHLTGRRPSRMHFGTPVYWNVSHAEDFAVDPYIRHFVKPEFAAIVETHPMTLALAWAEAQGWKIDDSQFRRFRNNTLKRGLYLIRYDDEGRKDEGTMYPDGSIRWYVRAGKWVSGWKETFVYRDGAPIN